MGKLTTLKANFNRDNLKDLYKNVKKSVQIGVLSSALIANSMVMTNCSPDGGDTVDEPQTIEQPTTNPTTPTPTDGAQTEQGEENTGNGSENENQNSENESGNTGNNGNENENTENSNENQNTGNGNSGNESGNTGNNGNENQNTGNGSSGNESSNTGNNGNENQNTGNGNSGNESGNTGNENVNYGGEPYDKEIGNGNYILHNFVGENTYFPVENIVASTTHYLDKAETYVKDLANRLNATLEKEGRTDAQNYFNDLITAVNNDDFYIDANYPGRNTFDLAINDIDSAAKPYIADIIKNLPTENDRYAFYITYRILANESRKEGLGTYRQYPSDQMDAYQNAKNDIFDYIEADKEDGGHFVNIDITKDYETDNFKQTTDLLDDMLDLAVTNMNKQKNNNNYLRANDLRQVINLSIATNSLASMHDLTQYNLGHEHCTLSLGMNVAMENAINAPYITTTTQQNQDQSMGL